MKTVLIIPAVAFTLLTFCSPDRDRHNRDTGMGGATAGGLSSNDTMPTASSDSTAPAGNATPTPSGMLSQLSVANGAETRLAGAMAKQAKSPQVKQVARKLAADHARNLQQLRLLAQKENLSITPVQGAGAASDSTALPPDLQGKSGAELDRAFVQHEIQEHQANIEKIRSQMIPAAQSEQVRSYLQKTVAEMESHLAALQRVDKQLGA